VKSVPGRSKGVMTGTDAPGNGDASSGDAANAEGKSPVKREDLKLICFDYLW